MAGKQSATKAKKWHENKFGARVCLPLRNLQLCCYIAHPRSHVTVICRNFELFLSVYTSCVLLCVSFSTH
jgi:hypothetical protein